jgi:DNA-binding response OmpR family regulator
MRVLVVDDDEATRRLLVRNLQLASYDVAVGAERADETEMVLGLPLVMWHQAEAPLT